MSTVPLSQEQRQQLHAVAARAQTWMWINLLIALVGAAISIGTVTAASSSDTGGTYVVFWGAVVFGVWYAIKNAITMNRTRALLRRSPTAATQHQATPRRTPARPTATKVGTLVDVETGEAVGVATTDHVRYAKQSADQTLRVDANGQPFAHGDRRWLKEHTRVVRIKDARETAPAGSAGPPPTLLGRNLRILEETSASLAHCLWNDVTPRDMEVGRLAAVSMDGQRRLLFEGNAGGRLVLDQKTILGAEQVAAGLNYVVEVEYGTKVSEARVVCVVGPRGRMAAIFDAVGHPI